MKALCIHAHFDDFEFTAAGLFELWRRKLGPDFRGRILVCTDGKAGHQFRTREETGRMRVEEQQKSAALGGLELEVLQLPNGKTPREACLQIDSPFLAALWRSIRAFEPDYIFCPPYPSDPRAGVHVDHWAVAEAVRKVAYMINVPHAFTPEFPADETKPIPCKVPVILNVYDAYMAGSNGCDIAVDIEESFDTMARMCWCHQSQIAEWLPWVGRHQFSKPANFEQWKETLAGFLEQRNAEFGMPRRPLANHFFLTSWGEPASAASIQKDFPNLLPMASGAR